MHSPRRNGKSGPARSASPAGRTERPGPRPPAARRPAGAAVWLELLHLPPIGMVLLAAGGATVVAFRGEPPLLPAALYLLALLLTQLAISLHNDYSDRRLDAEAKPWRVVPSGRLPARPALGIAALLLAGGLAAAVPLGGLVFGLVALGAVSGLAYNAWFKNTAWTWLPFWIALPTLPLGALALAGRLGPDAWPAYVIAAPLVLGVYLADTLDDIATDAGHGVRGLAHRLGPGPARLAAFSSVALAQAMALALWPGAAAPGTLFWTAPALLGAAVLSDRAGWSRGRWLGIMGGAVALAIAWVAALP